MKLDKQKIGGFLTTALVAVVLAGCGGDKGDRGDAGESGETTIIGILPVSSATTLDITIDDVTINSAPVVEFTAKDADGVPIAGLTTSHVRFNIAKLTPGTMGDPSAWQNYINRERTGAAGTFLQGYYERIAVNLEDMGNGQYRYSFGTDITDPTKTVGNISYNPALTHRLAIQISGFPAANPTYDFRPDGLPITTKREIVKIENCNSCHNKLALHGGGRIETKYCVTCHNPGSTDPESGNTADFKVMIHKIHRGEDLPGGVPYGIGGRDYSTVAFPQDIRNCSKCHDGSDPATTQGDNWKTKLSMQACGSCHDDKDFSIDGAAWGANDPLGHSGGIMNDNSNCITCHSTTIFGSVEEAHFLAEPVARQNFKLNILRICGVDVVTNPSPTTPGPQCATGSMPTVTFSITNPLNNDARYAITAPEIAGSNLSFLVAWDTDDYNNTDGTGARPSRADSISISGATEDAPVGSRIYTTLPAGFIIPDGTLSPPNFTNYTATGSGAIGAQGRLVGDFDNDTIYGESGANNSVTGEQERIFVKSEVAYFRIDDPVVVPRRPTVDNANCNQCHDQVSFHGGSRSGEYGVCILCHNPNNTDIRQRTGGPVPPDGKDEEAIDFKRMIHGIHAGAQINYDSSPGHGFREKGLVLYDNGKSVHDYSHTRFPGILRDCETCHQPGSYFLDGKWASPTANGILSSTVDTSPGSSIGIAGTDPTWVKPDDDLNISPTAAVCSACHDGDVAKAHMIALGGAVFDQTQTVISSTIVETCSVCHGPGHIADVEVVHGLD